MRPDREGPGALIDGPAQPRPSATIGRLPQSPRCCTRTPTHPGILGKTAGHFEYRNNIKNLWSGGIQLYWRDVTPGDRLETRFDCATPGTYTYQGC